MGMLQTIFLCYLFCNILVLDYAMFVAKSLNSHITPQALSSLAVFYYVSVELYFTISLNINSSTLAQPYDCPEL